MLPEDLRLCLVNYRTSARNCTSSFAGTRPADGVGNDDTAGCYPHGSFAAVGRTVAPCPNDDGRRVYSPVSELGSGGTARVDLVQLGGTQHLAALKAYTVFLDEGNCEGRQDKALDADKARQALVELHVLQACAGNPHLPQLLDAFIDGTDLCIVIEVAKGKDLMTLLGELPSNYFPEAQVKGWAMQMLDALESLHSQGITYVDIKPENIILDPESGSVTMVDFGLCHVPIASCREASTAFAGLLSSEAVQAWMTPLPCEGENPRFWGTMEYAAPEVIDGGAAAFSPLSDFWSLGILLYELLYGRTPFRGHGMEQTFYNIRMRGVVFPAQPEVSYDMQQLIRGLLRQKPEYRLGASKGVAELRSHRALRQQ